MLMQQFIRNTPITCPKCKSSIRGQERDISRDKEVVTECTWRCYHCGIFVKHGIIKTRPR